MTMMCKDGRDFMTLAKYMAKLANMETSSIVFVRDDAKAAANAMPEGKNAMFYALEYDLCCAELRARIANAQLSHDAEVVHVCSGSDMVKEECDGYTCLRCQVCHAGWDFCS